MTKIPPNLYNDQNKLETSKVTQNFQISLKKKRKKEKEKNETMKGLLLQNTLKS